MLDDVLLDQLMTHDPRKHAHNDGHVYLRQPYTVEIIQLEEVTPPSPHSIPSSSASPASSSSSSYYDDESDEEEDSDCTSYCSSDYSMQDEPRTKDAAYAEDTYSARMSRIHAWRESFSKEVGALAPGAVPMASSPPVSRREDRDADGDLATSCSEAEEDAGSQRVYAAAGVPQSSRLSTLSLHSCPACDASFDTSQSLRRHGRGPLAGEACRVAVEYDFE
ncbi:hypothetical protein GLOTRDRAFT_115845 [Gloeophyllum trabeum ATCC 11539]|uniref:Uncharacterized protein n=1 Tax=Gloeophyllum trabeum (strain ATCC 11539 / FP-39264 / Madison 617) TaxID=670483 RepID=S7RQ34_GLOTA|nr:uncharacterized protein GLOTRDRAFT_115845 [Gloeophyllum trabeum ATCC 11539]EPQ56700.1 hypothetical protein GLOTRDRAFT_115845 [Gloeophyllum trabeum ATCC 11539]